MKIMYSFLVVAFGLNFAACIKCDKPAACDPTQKAPACKDVVPTDEMCAAYFTRWFYNSESDNCQQIGYSGCSQKGFATRQECEACKCE